MSKVPLARVAAFNPFAHYLGSGGCDMEKQLSAAGIDPELLGSAENLLPLLPACEFVHDMGRKVGVEKLGLEVGSRASMSELGMFGTILSQSLTLKDLIGKFTHWLPAVNSGARAWIETVGTSQTFRLVFRHEVDTGRVIADSFALMLLIDAVRMAAGPDWRPKKASLDRAGGDNLHQFEALSDAEIDRNVDYIALEIPSRFFSMPVIKPAKKCGLNRIEDDSLTSTAPSEDLVGSISQAIRAGLTTRVVTIQHAAKMAGMGVRMLQRRLSEEGLVYSDLVDRVRFQEAGKLLLEADMKIAEISYSLGYSNPANFTHAFQRWSGITPSTYRAEALQGIHW